MAQLVVRLSTLPLLLLTAAAIHTTSAQSLVRSTPLATKTFAGDPGGTSPEPGPGPAGSLLAMHTLSGDPGGTSPEPGPGPAGSASMMAMQ